MKIKVKRDPIEHGNFLYMTDEYEFNKGINVIIGRNGSGKTTLLNCVKSWCEENKVPCFSWDNYSDGGRRAHEFYSFKEDFGSLATVMMSSEGQQIMFNLGKQIEKIGNFIRKNKEHKQLVVLLDAVDSGLDVEGIEQLKDVLRVATKDCEKKDIELYILITANNYAMVEDENCINVVTSNHVWFVDFTDYANYIKRQRKEKITL